MNKSQINISIKAVSFLHKTIATHDDHNRFGGLYGEKEEKVEREKKERKALEEQVREKTQYFALSRILI